MSDAVGREDATPAAVSATGAATTAPSATDTRSPPPSRPAPRVSSASTFAAAPSCTSDGDLIASSAAASGLSRRGSSSSKTGSRRARSASATAPDTHDSSGRGSGGGLDAWLIFDILNTATDKQVISYLIENLYRLSDDDVDFFLPQICTLIMVGSPTDSSKDLEIFILYKSVKSVHFALKCYWNLHAMQYYARTEIEKQRCEDLRTSLEMVVVNGKLPRRARQHIPRFILELDSGLSFPVLHPPDPGLIHGVPPLTPPLSSVKSPHHSSAAATSSTAASTTAAAASSSTSGSVGSTSVQSSPKRASSSNVRSVSKSAKRASKSRRHRHRSKTSISSGGGSHGSSHHHGSSAHRHRGSSGSGGFSGREERYSRRSHHFLKKQRRCSYFNAQLDFAHFLEGISAALESAPKMSRQQLLEQNLEYANSHLPQGLYLPTARSAQTRHRSMLRICANECVCLDSAAKVPFMLFCLVKCHSYETASERIIEELKEVRMPGSSAGSSTSMSSVTETATTATSGTSSLGSTPAVSPDAVAAMVSAEMSSAMTETSNETINSVTTANSASSSAHSSVVGKRRRSSSTGVIPDSIVAEEVARRARDERKSVEDSDGTVVSAVAASTALSDGIAKQTSDSVDPTTAVSAVGDSEMISVKPDIIPTSSSPVLDPRYVVLDDGIAVMDTDEEELLDDMDESTQSATPVIKSRSIEDNADNETFEEEDNEEERENQEEQKIDESTTMMVSEKIDSSLGLSTEDLLESTVSTPTPSDGELSGSGSPRRTESVTADRSDMTAVSKDIKLVVIDDDSDLPTTLGDTQTKKKSTDGDGGITETTNNPTGISTPVRSQTPPPKKRSSMVGGLDELKKKLPKVPTKTGRRMASQAVEGSRMITRKLKEKKLQLKQRLPKTTAMHMTGHRPSSDQGRRRMRRMSQRRRASRKGSEDGSSERRSSMRIPEQWKRYAFDDSISDLMKSPPSVHSAMGVDDSLCSVSDSEFESQVITLEEAQRMIRRWSSVPTEDLVVLGSAALEHQLPKANTIDVALSTDADLIDAEVDATPPAGIADVHADDDRPTSIQAAISTSSLSGTDLAAVSDESDIVDGKSTKKQQMLIKDDRMSYRTASSPGYRPSLSSNKSDTRIDQRKDGDDEVVFDDATLIKEEEDDPSDAVRRQRRGRSSSLGELVMSVPLKDVPAPVPKVEDFERAASIRASLVAMAQAEPEPGTSRSGTTKSFVSKIRERTTKARTAMKKGNQPVSAYSHHTTHPPTTPVDEEPALHPSPSAATAMSEAKSLDDHDTVDVSASPIVKPAYMFRGKSLRWDNPFGESWEVKRMRMWREYHALFNPAVSSSTMVASSFVAAGLPPVPPVSTAAVSEASEITDKLSEVSSVVSAAASATTAASSSSSSSASSSSDPSSSVDRSLPSSIDGCPFDLTSVIFKSGEDMRQEQFAMQFVILFDRIFREADLPLHLRPYSVVVTSPASGFVETVTSTTSISRLKHRVRGFRSLRKFFEEYFGPVGSPGFTTAQRNFTQSLAASSLLCYALNLKDRHNGNILLDSEGHLIHIDFGFIFSNSPGMNLNFETAPFKLTAELIQVMQSNPLESSEMYDYFKVLLVRGFLELRKHLRKLTLLLRIMLKGAPLPCLQSGLACVTELENRFVPHLKNDQCVEFVYSLVELSAYNWRSIQYDKFQRITNDIL